MQVTDSDGDVAEATIVVNVLDDVPFSLETDNVGVGGGSVTAEEGENSGWLTVLPARNRGADDAVIKSVTINGEQHELAQGLNNSFTVTQGVGGQILGTLTVQSSGNIRFTADPSIDHGSATNNRFVETFSYEILDGDGDIVVGTTQIIVVDDEPQLIVNNAGGIEDQGRLDDPDDDEVANPLNGIAIKMTVDIGDYDQGEHVDRVTITLPANAHGTFYANGSELPISNGVVTLPGSLFTPDADNVLWTLQGVTFVPDQDYSASNGIPTFTVNAYVDNSNGSERALAQQSFTITVEGIADVPQWDDDNTVTYYSVDEDSDGATLSIRADLQDNDGSEALNYLLSIDSGSASLILDGSTLSPDASGVYLIAAADINQVVVKPDANFSGDVVLTATAQARKPPTM